VRRALTYEAYVKELNRQIRKHPNYRKGMRVTKIHGSLYEMTPPNSVGPNDPDAMRRFREDPSLMKVFGDSLSAVQRKYYCVEQYARGTRLPGNLLFRLSREGRRSRRLQTLLHTLHGILTEYKRSHGFWPADVAPLIESYRLLDPWKAGRPLHVKYTVPSDSAGNQNVLVEYIREGTRAFALYVDGCQDTWEL
jgi:hypothetical protein